MSKWPPTTVDIFAMRRNKKQPLPLTNPAAHIGQHFPFPQVVGIGCRHPRLKGHTDRNTPPFQQLQISCYPGAFYQRTERSLPKRSRTLSRKIPHSGFIVCGYRSPSVPSGVP